jgi:hypothetical protein
VEVGNPIQALFVSRDRDPETAMPCHRAIFEDKTIAHNKLRNFVVDVRIDLFDCDYLKIVGEYGLSFVSKKDGVKHFLLQGENLPYIVSILDTVYINDKDISEKTYRQRMEYTKHLVHICKKSGIIIGHETWNPNTDNSVIYKQWDSGYDSTGRRSKDWIKRKPSIAEQMGKPIYSWISGHSYNSRHRLKEIEISVYLRKKNGKTEYHQIAFIDIPMKSPLRDLLEIKIDGRYTFNTEYKNAVLEIDGTYITRAGILKNAFVKEHEYCGKVKSDCVLEERGLALLAEERVKKV